MASLGLDSYLSGHPGSSGIFVETAHPAKFTEIVEPMIEKTIAMPECLRERLNGEKQSVVMKTGYSYLADYLNERYSLK